VFVSTDASPNSMKYRKKSVKNSKTGAKVVLRPVDSELSEQQGWLLGHGAHTRVWAIIEHQ
jgi:hypothetical protein